MLKRIYGYFLQQQDRELRKAIKDTADQIMLLTAERDGLASLLLDVRNECIALRKQLPGPAEPPSHPYPGPYGLDEHGNPRTEPAQPVPCAECATVVRETPWQRCLSCPTEPALPVPAAQTATAERNKALNAVVEQL